MKLKYWAFLVLAPAFALTLALAQAFYLLNIKTYSGKEFVFNIKAGESFGSINHRLSKKNAYSSAKLFHRYNQAKNEMQSFKVGSYVIAPGMTMLDIMSLLKSGKGMTIKVTFPEGKNLFQMAEILEKKGITKASDFIKWAKDSNFSKSLNIPGARVEGHLYPDTYFFPPKMAAKQIIKTMVSTFRSKSKDLNWASTKLSPYEVVTLASIVEKETGASFERPQISGVFHNRLKKRMRLQSDPTTIYGIWENFNGNLRKKHLKQKTAYNTYKMRGLPVGPIANPGLNAIKAALKPQKHQYLYFVSKNDGTHVFSKTYREHRRAVEKFQKDRRQRKGKSWRQLKQK